MVVRLIAVYIVAAIPDRAPLAADQKIHVGRRLAPLPLRRRKGKSCKHHRIS
jgi:hypothetical protein